MFFIYAKEEDGNATDACCILMTPADAVSTFDGSFACSQIEGIENEGLSGDPYGQSEVFERIYGKTGLMSRRLAFILHDALVPMERELRKTAATESLHLAMYNDDTEGVEESIANGADVNATDNYDRTPLQWAAENGYANICKLLIDAGAVVNYMDYDGLTPLHYVNSLEACEVLINAGADVNAQDKHGDTPLHDIAGCGDIVISKCLINAGADVNIQNKKGRTPLLNAAVRNKPEVCELLIDAGADVNARDGEGRSPLSCARTMDYKKVVELLLKAGAQE